VDVFRSLLACPACGGALSAEWACVACDRRFAAHDGIPNLRIGGDARTEAVRRFYDGAPFPGYPPRDSVHALRRRAERSVFPALLDRAIPADARIADVGCGTGQMALYLARADRVVIGADLVRASLRLAASAACRYGIDGVRFVETDLQQPGLRPASFDIVFSSGVLHHTIDPEASFARLARLARPGGIIVVGVYDAIARLPSRLRRAAARASGFRVLPFDPVLRARTDPSRRDAWLRDQYRHPEEHTHTIAEVKRWLAANEVAYLRTYPSTVFGDDSTDLFAPADDDWCVEDWLAQLEWTRTLGREGGLFFTIGQRALQRPSHEPGPRDAAASSAFRPRSVESP
jgi:SAM-dependent methyltransferase